MIRRFFRREQQPGAGNVAQGRDFQPGDLVEQRYDVEHIRAGFMGIVYIAYDLKRRSRVVLKTFQNKFLWNEAAIQRFNRELDAILMDKEMAAKILAIGPITEGAGTPEQMNAFLQAEHSRWSKLTKDIGVLPE